MWRILMVVVLFGAGEAASGCKNCVMMLDIMRELAMFVAHSLACLAQSGADADATAAAAAAMLRGELRDSPALRRHVYCVLLACKLVGKDGKLQKAAILGKMAAKGDSHATKVLKACSEQTGDSPEDLAWNIFRCSYDKKAVLFDFMPIVPDSEEN